MTKLGEFKELFKCGFCQKIFEDPVFLPCLESVCRAHSEDVCAEPCLFCDQKHSVPEEGFVSDKRTKKMLELEVNKISLQSESYDQCKKAIDEIATLNSYVDSILQDPKNFIYEYFSELKNKVDLKKESLSADLNNWYEKIIDEINQAQSRCEEESSKNLGIFRGLNKDISIEDNKNLVKLFESFEISIDFIIILFNI